MDPAAEDRDWARKQRFLTNAATGLTGAGALALGGALAGKTRAAQRVLPKRVSRAMRSGRADDIRNSIALASMIGGTASGVHWAKRLRTDERDPQLRASNVAQALSGDVRENVAKGTFRDPSIVRRWSRKGLSVSTRRGGYAASPRRIRAKYEE